MLAATIVVLSVLLACRGNPTDDGVGSRSSPSVPVSKGGWRPVVGNGGAGGPAGGTTGELHVEPTTLRSHVARDVSKLTTASQAHRPMLLYTQPGLPFHSPVNSYLNPFALNHPAVTSYKMMHNYPAEGTLMRLPQPVFAQRPALTKYPAPTPLGSRYKVGHLQGAVMQKLHTANHFHQPLYQKKPVNSYGKPLDAYAKPLDFYAKPVEQYLRPADIFRKPDNSGSLQEKQPVKTFQQSLVAPFQAQPSNFYNYDIKEALPAVPASILGSFTSFGHQSIKSRDPPHVVTKNTYLPPPPTKQTVFNSFSYTPTQKPTTVRTLQTSNYVMYGNVETQKSIQPPAPVGEQKQQHNDQYPLSSIHSNKNQHYPKDNFKPSPQDPFAKPKTTQSLPKLTNPVEFKDPAQNFFYETANSIKPHREVSTYFPTPTTTVDLAAFNSYDKHNLRDNLSLQAPPPYTSVSAGTHQTHELNKDNYYSREKAPPTFNLQDHQFIPYSTTVNTESPPRTVPFKATYEVTETWGPNNDESTQSVAEAWFNSPQSYNTILRPESPPPQLPSTEPSPLANHALLKKPLPDNLPIFDFEVSTKRPIGPGNKHRDEFVNYNKYSWDAETQNQRPVEDEHIANTYSKLIHREQGQYKINTTPTYNEVSVTNFKTVKPKLNKVKKRPTESYKPTEYTTQYNIDDDQLELTTIYENYKDHQTSTENNFKVESLPTLPPNMHFRRPSSERPIYERDHQRKRNKNRRRRPSATLEPKYPKRPIPTLPVEDLYTTETIIDETTQVARSTRKPLLKKAIPTKPTVTSELTSSAQPTLSPTPPATSKTNKYRLTTLPVTEGTPYTTTGYYKTPDFASQQSSIMKISSGKQPGQRFSPSSYDYNLNDTPDYSHKQDEKDTPTSDIAVDTTDIENYSEQRYQPEMIDEKISASIYRKQYETTTSSAGTTREHEVTFTTVVENVGLNEQKLGKRGNVKSVEEISDNNDDKFPIITSSTPATLKTENETQASSKTQRPRNKLNKYDNNRPRFSVKEYRNRLSQFSSTSTTERTSEQSSTKFRFPSRRLPILRDNDNKVSTGENQNMTEAPRKKFVPKDPRHKLSPTELHQTEPSSTERSSFSSRTSARQRYSSSTSDPLDNEIITPKVSARIRTSSRRDPLRNRTSSTTPVSLELTTDSTTKPNITKRPSLRKKIKEAEKLNLFETSGTDFATDSTQYPKTSFREETSSERQTSETAIMKIAKEEKKQPVFDYSDNASSEQSKRVADLTLAASKDYNTPGMFKAVPPNSRRIPNYFTIATDDPILPIEAFFPQLNNKRETQ